VLVWARVLLILSFLAYLPYSKHLHIATAAINVWFGRTRARGRLSAALRRGGRGELRFGRRHDRRSDLEGDARHVLLHRVRALPGRLSRVHDRARRSPKLLIMALRDRSSAGAGAAGGGEGRAGAARADSGHDEVVWDCVTCGACVEACPVSIEHVITSSTCAVTDDGRFALPGRGRADAA